MSCHMYLVYNVYLVCSKRNFVGLDILVMYLGYNMYLVYNS